MKEQEIIYDRLDRVLRNNLCVFFFYLIISIIITYPIIFNMTSSILTNHFDPFGHIWRVWNMGRTGFFSFQWLNKTDMIFYPHGSNIPYPFQADFYIPLLLFGISRILPLVLSWNILTLVSVALTGFSIYLLVRYIVRCNLSAFLCGLFFIASISYMEELYEGILEQTSLYLLIFYILFLLKAFNEKGRANILLAVLFFVLACSNSTYHIVFAVIFTFFFYLSKEKNPLRKRVFLVLVAVVLALVSYWMKDKRDEMTIGALFMPRNINEFIHSRTSIGGETYVHHIDNIAGGSLKIDNFISRRKMDPIRSYGIGYLYILGILGLFFDFKRSKFWFFISLLFFFLSLGPYLIYHDKLLFPLPTVAVYWLFPYYMLIKPARFLKIVQISFVILAGIALKQFFGSEFISKRGKGFLFAGILLLPLLQLVYIGSFPYPCSVLSLKVPAYYNSLASEKGDFASIEMPLYPSGTALAGKFLFYQTVHGKKLVNSNFIFLDEKKKLLSWMDDNTFIKFLLSDFRQEFNLCRAIKMEDIESLKKAGIKYVILHQSIDAEPAKFFPMYLKDQLFGLHFTQVLKDLFGKPEIFDDGILVFRLDAYKSFPNGEYILPAKKTIKKLVETKEISLQASLVEKETFLTVSTENFTEMSFWYTGTGDENDPHPVVSIYGLMDRGMSMLGSAQIFPDKEFWKRAEISIKSLPKKGRFIILVSRPYGLEKNEIEVKNLEIRIDKKQ